MKKLKWILTIIAFLSIEQSQAQVFRARGVGRLGRLPREKNHKKQYRNNFEPTVNLSAGYGFPNLDKQQLVDFGGYTKGNFSQTGPVTAAIDYRFTRQMSIGLMVTHGKVSVPYRDYLGNTAITGSLDNWAFLFNIIRYIPVSNGSVTPYLRTAIGVNSWKQDYSYSSGAPINSIEKPADLAYQAGIGVQVKLSKNAGLFLEAGYGKYILQGGLALHF